ncbi:MULTISPECIES: helix-turn-helix domain-containing protein [Marinobacter]|uniref:Type II toxin-antitoxin system HigA family antitoxin n=1 Tax=Marinobacter shengliensis TaxID=1389223 RepID=A0ABV4W1T4_9GAMM|nr:transcriptional regulator [Marinobacter sp.]MDX5441943.1 transcriptional regulator [Alteromonadaceae bacterium]MDX5328593.1 transcriptional regulator [Marinobacter sp.]MDX5334828.1 transcriptional regulator [Marinobacter sp.]MDX5385456.1 transcriptional regulator [Marinobacter sp.]MDX5471096.1 transcriptional regulator [Marinobacter sp.]
MLSTAFVEIREALARVPFIAHIETEEDYDRALELMDELVDDYDANKLLIEVLAVSIERWEDQAPEFSDFNAAVDETDRGIAVLKTLMAQHGLGVADLPELGSKGNVSKILNGAEGKKLTRKHMEALGKRFEVPPVLFF